MLKLCALILLFPMMSWSNPCQVRQSQGQSLIECGQVTLIINRNAAVLSQRELTDLEDALQFVEDSQEEVPSELKVNAPLILFGGEVPWPVTGDEEDDKS